MESMDDKARLELQLKQEKELTIKELEQWKLREKRLREILKKAIEMKQLRNNIARERNIRSQQSNRYVILERELRNQIRMQQ